jgi:hypothetical protein
MKCCFSQEEIPTDKLLVLYYPPAMAHYSWDKSVYAAARAREALKQVVHGLKTIYWKGVVGNKLAPGLIAGLIGLTSLGFWVLALARNGLGAGYLRLLLLPFVGLALLLFARLRSKAFLRRRALWKNEGQDIVGRELRAIEADIAKMPPDPSAEQAAAVLRRECPSVISEIAFDGSYFRAFTYMDFVMYPQLRHPTAEGELPTKHSRNRDAYYVGDIVYDGWRLFQKDQRELEDPRFIGSGGRRGVI